MGIFTKNIEVNKKDVKNLSSLTMYELDDRYVANNKGDVFLILYNKKRTYVVKKIKPFITRDGYVEYVLTNENGVKKHIQAHRIVALLYLPNKNKHKKYVNHKDGNKLNNSVDNLEWVTASENIYHSYNTLGKVVWNKNKKISK